MLKNYLKIALRNLRRHRAYTFINVTGLAVGMACCLLILLFVRDERAYDRFHANADRVYRVVSDWGDFSIPSTNPPAIRALRADYPSFPIAVLFQYEALIRHEEQMFAENVVFASPEVFDVFTLDVLRGDPATALLKPNTGLVTEATARKYFGDEDPIGKRLLADNQFEIEITGVVRALPPQSHVHFDILASFDTLEPFTSFSTSTQWGNNSYYTYVLLPEGYDAATLEHQFPDFIARHAGDDWNGSVLSLQKLTDIHLHSHHNMELEPNGNVAYVYVFSAVALFILLVACVNFMNLSTARAADRAKEVGLRKVVGAQRRQLVAQFLSESVLLACLALVLAVGLVALALPGFRALSGKAIGLNVLDDGFMLLAFFSVTTLVGVLAGSYPAFVLSGFRPASVLKGTFRSSTRGVRLRKGLVVFQFATSVVLIVGALVVYRQLDYLRGASLGFDQEQVLVLPHQDSAIREQYDTFRSAVLQQPDVLDVTIASEGFPSELLNGNGTTLASAPDDAYDNNLFVPTRTVSIGYDFFETIGVDMAHGRAFSRERATDSTAFVFNETAARILQERFPDQIPTPGAAVGMELRMGGRRGPLVGIANDFNMSTLREKVEPIVFFINPNQHRYFLVRVAPGDVAGTVAAVRGVWERLYPDWPFDFTFADQAFDDQYRTEERLGQIFFLFAGLAIFIACLGLFGLASFTTTQRTKEIGVRKVMGATVAGLVVLLAKDFARLVLAAFVVAAPLAYLAMDRWLDTFAYRTDIAWWTFAVAGAGALSVALLSVGYQSIRAALADPVKSLRYE